MAIRLASITLNSGQTTVTVNSPAVDLTTAVQPGYELMVEGASLPFTIVSGGVNQLTIDAGDAPSVNLVDRVAKIIPTKGALNLALDALNNAGSEMLALQQSKSVSAQPDSIAQRDSDGRVFVAAATSNSHAVNKGQLGAGAFSLDAALSGIGTTSATYGSTDMDFVQNNGIFSVANSFTNDPAWLTPTTFPFLNMRSNAERACQIVPSSNNRIGYRTQVGGVYAPWLEFFTEGNANFKSFGGAAASDQLAVGYRRTSTEVRFSFPWLKHSPPSSITTVGTFFIFDPETSTTIATGVTPVLESVSGPGMAVVSVSGLTGINGAGPYLLQATDGTSKITFNE